MPSSTLGSGTLVLAGSTSGTTTVTATAVAGTTTLTLPAATDTLVGKATTDTLTNKTLTGAAMNGTLGATTPSSVAATTITASSTLAVTGVTTVQAGTAALPAITTTGDTNTGIFFPAADTIAFSEGGAESMRINSSGNVGIGTSSPTSILQVSAATPTVQITGTGTTASSQDFTTNSAAQRTTIGVERSTGGGLFVGSTAYAAVFGSAGASNTEFAANNTVRMTISTSGSIGAPTGTNIYNASDARLKKNIQPLTKGLDAVNALKPVSFNWITDFCTVENDKVMYGFVAQDTREVDENLVEGFNNGSDVVVGDLTVKKAMRVNEKFIIPMLTKAIQELKAINDQQAETITALTARIVALEGK